MTLIYGSMKCRIFLSLFMDLPYILINGLGNTVNDLKLIVGQSELYFMV